MKPLTNKEKSFILLRHKHITNLLQSTKILEAALHKLWICQDGRCAISNIKLNRDYIDDSCFRTIGIDIIDYDKEIKLDNLRLTSSIFSMTRRYDKIRSNRIGKIDFSMTRRYDKTRSNRIGEIDITDINQVHYAILDNYRDWLINNQFNIPIDIIFVRDLIIFDWIYYNKDSSSLFRFPLAYIELVDNYLFIRSGGDLLDPYTIDFSCPDIDINQVITRVVNNYINIILNNYLSFDRIELVPRPLNR